VSIVKTTTRFTSVLLLALAATSCKREERTFRVEPPSADPVTSVAVSALFPGAQPTTAPVKNDYEQNAYALAEGKRLFSQYNCSGCHANGGGGIGPPLIDDEWLYGYEPQQVYATIVQGRPNGMPAYMGKIPDYQVWELAGYVRSMSGLAPSAASPGRNDDMQGPPPENSVDTSKPPKNTRVPS
jgi:cytochrome c oxidase cbb3-type subunit III